MECSNFIQDNNDTMYVIGKPLKIIGAFYSERLESSILNVQEVEAEPQKHLQIYLCEDILAKICKMPFNENYVVFPIIHMYSESKIS